MHVDEGTLRALVDGELSESEETRVRDHLNRCDRCQEIIEELTARAERVHGRMASLDLTEKSTSIDIIRERLQVHIVEKETSMLGRLFQRKYRLAWTTALVVIVLGISMLFPQVRVLAGRLLELFRVEQIQAVEVGLTLEMLPDYMERYFQSFEALLGDQIDIEELIEPREVRDANEASNLAGFNVRLPTEVEGELHIVYQAAKTVSYKLDRDLLQSLLDELGYSDVVIPENVDGKEVTIHFPDIVAALYGDCAIEEGEDQSQPTQGETCMILIQGRSPTVDIPPELDLNRLGEVFLQMMGMSAEEASHFSEHVDWLTTLVLPIPEDAQYEDIPSVDGVPGVLVKDQIGKDMARYTLLWVKSGILHGLIGIDDPDRALSVADSLK
ncbi:MAG TPA: zf-HC2 domain-containing protein [Anaerolineae bacterium]|nr:zf-HC2 domain-containing protein [Anaerolineae bacterium]